MAKKKIKNKYISELNVCPFCKTRKTGDERYCFGCNLNFADCEGQTLKDVFSCKKSGKFLQSYEGEIVLSPLPPSDISISTMKMLAIFLGLFGIHNFYAGRIIRGIIALCSAILAISLFALNFYFFKNNIVTIIASYGAIICIPMYITDIYSVFKRKYKFPLVLKHPIDVDNIYKAGTKEWKP